MDDELDEAILNLIPEYEGLKLKAINKNETSNELKDENFKNWRRIQRHPYKSKKKSSRII